MFGVYVFFCSIMCVIHTEINQIVVITPFFLPFEIEIYRAFVTVNIVKHPVTLFNKNFKQIVDIESSILNCV